MNHAVDIVCGGCGETDSRLPANYVRNDNCRVCAGLCPKLAKARFLEVVKRKGHVMGPKFNYVNTSTSVVLTCSKCLSDFDAVPNAYVRNRVSCKVCRGVCPDQARKDLEAKIAESGDAKAADYSYVDTSTKVSIVCGGCGETNSVWPNNYRNGGRCPCRAPSGYNPSLPSILYYLVFYPTPDRAVYKIGVTNRTVEKRYEWCHTPYEIIWVQQFEDGYRCKEIEQQIIEENKQYRCKDTPVHKLGNKELFDRDIMQGARIRMTG
jgi:hypothetical protein